MSYLGAAKKGNSKNKARQIVDKTFDSHPNSSKTQAKLVQKKDSTSLFSTIVSESDWDDSKLKKYDKVIKNDGPLLLAANPNKNFCDVEEKKTEDKRELLQPQRHWEKEKLPKEQNYQINNFSAHPQPAQPVNVSVPPTAKIPTRLSGYDKPKTNKPTTIREVSSQITATGENGVEIFEDKSVFHDDFQVYRSSAYKRKMKWLEKLKENTENKGLKPAKGRYKNRFVLSYAHPDTTEEDVKIELLENFIDVIDEIFVRKNPMRKFRHYCDFVVFITSNEPLDIDMIEKHNYPGDIRVFFAPNKRRYEE